jgi:hypothetical protein
MQGWAFALESGQIAGLSPHDQVSLHNAVYFPPRVATARVIRLVDCRALQHTDALRLGAPQLSKMSSMRLVQDNFTRCK